MSRTIGFAALTAGFLAFGPAEVGAQKKNQAMEVAEAATDADYKQLKKIKDMTGKLASVNSMSVTFRLDIPYMEPNPNYRPPKVNTNQQQQMQNLYRQQSQAMAIKNPVQRQMKLQQLMQNQQYQQMLQALRAASNTNPNNQPFRIAHNYRDYELDLSEKVVIRKMFLEQEYDDKGKLKTYTKEELAELRGKDTTKPGYKAQVEDLQSGQQVKIYLAMPKKTKPAADKAEDKTTDKEKAPEKDKADNDKAADKTKVPDKADQSVDKSKKPADDTGTAKEEVVKPLITMIVILQPLDPNAPANLAPAKKKNNAN